MRFGVAGAWPGGLRIISGGAGSFVRSAAWQVIAEAGPAPAGPLRGGGLAAGGELSPGAGLTDGGGPQQQRGEQRAGGDAPGPAPGGRGEGLLGGVLSASR